MNSLTKNRWMIVMALFCAMVMSSSPLYAGGAGIKVGTLVIKAIPSTRTNLIIKSSVEVTAVFTDANGKKEYYIGEMGQKLGVDLSLKGAEELGYLVFSAATKYKTGSYAMEGKYFGTKASATVGGGVSAQMLLGGFDKSISLQPFSLGGTEGYGASLGLGYLYLQRDHSRN